jgi:hypothetical protein
MGRLLLLLLQLLQTLLELLRPPQLLGSIPRCCW